MKSMTRSLSAVSPVRALAILACVTALAGCTTVKGWFGGNKPDAQLTKPAPLAAFTPSAQAVRVWSMKIGGGEGRIGARQTPAIADGRVYAAAFTGGVRAIELQSGRVLWTFPSTAALSGGPGVGDGLVVVGGLEGDVIALDAATGAQKWTAKVGNEVIAPPVIGQGMVLVRSNDGRVTAFDAASGAQRWLWNHEPPALSVRGNDGVLLGPGYVFVGNDDGTLSALSLADGSVVWEQTVAAAEGRNELLRMADVDGTPLLDGTTLYATSYKGRTVAIEGPSGRVLWEAGNGGAGRLGMGHDRLFAADAAGTLWAFDKTTGASMWQQAVLARRNLSGAAVQGRYAVVGDYEGYLHWFNVDDGKLAARVKAAGDAIRGAPVVVDDILVVQGADGDLSAWRITP